MEATTDLRAGPLTDRVSTLAQHVLWPAADDVDRGAVAVGAQLDRLAQAIGRV